MADITTLGESSQALLCSLADWLGDTKTNELFDISKYDTYDSFKRAVKSENIKTSYKRINTGVVLEDLEKFMREDNGWFESSVAIAKKIINELDSIDKDYNIKAKGFQDLYYFRGDKKVMGTITELFKSANIQSSKQPEQNGMKFFGDINKWSPADIYFSSNTAIQKLLDLKNESETKLNNLRFATLNKLIFDLIDSGDLLPLSLKKVEKIVKLVKVNFKRKDEIKLLSTTKCTGTEKYEEMKGGFKLKNNKTFILEPYSGGRDIYITLVSGGQQGRIQIRHTPASGGKPQKGVKVILSYRGSSALGGQVVGIPLFTNVLKSADIGIANEIMSSFNLNYPKFEKAANDYIKFGGGKKNYDSGKKDRIKQFNDDIGAISALTIMNPLRKIIQKFFSKKGEKQHNAVRAIFAYTASRTEKSSPFIIAKD
jgi:hypothetical protein